MILIWLNGHIGKLANSNSVQIALSNDLKLPEVDCLKVSLPLLGQILRISFALALS